MADDHRSTSAQTYFGELGLKPPCYWATTDSGAGRGGPKNWLNAMDSFEDARGDKAQRRLVLYFDGW